MTGHRFGFDVFAGKRAGDIDVAGRAERDAVAAMADMIDDDGLSHGARR